MLPKKPGRLRNYDAINLGVASNGLESRASRKFKGIKAEITAVETMAPEAREKRRKPEVREKRRGPEARA
jgi:hypothetical protein